MLRAPLNNAYRSPRSSESIRYRRWVIVTAVCFCAAVTFVNVSLMPLRHAVVSPCHASPNSEQHKDIQKAIEGITAAAGVAVQPAAASSVGGSSSSSSSSSSRSTTSSAVSSWGDSSKADDLHDYAKLVQSAFQDGTQALSIAGITLAGLQQMQIDRIRMQVELYAKGRLQQRRTKLEAELRALAASAAAVSAEQQADSTSSQQPYSKGILIVTGSWYHMANALVSIIVLRHVLDCTLPIELVYYGQEEHDPIMLDIIKEYIRSEGPALANLRIIDGAGKQVDLKYHYQSWGSVNGAAAGVGVRDRITGYAAKVHALAYVTSFQQVLLLDADNLPLMDPTELFESEAFAVHGNLFWPDFWQKEWLNADFYKKLGLDVPWQVDSNFQSTESGQVLIDRLRHVDVLEWLWWLNSHNSITYDNMLGDKDSYRLAFALANKLPEYQQIKLPPRDAMAVTDAVPGIMYKHQGMVQHTADERPAFLHRTARGKFFPVCHENSDASSCHIDYFTIPLTEAQAQLALHHELAYTESEADILSYPLRCRKNIPKNHYRPDDPRRCFLNEGQDLQPVSLVPVAEFKTANVVLTASYAVFEQVRTLIAVAIKLPSMSQDQQQGGDPGGDSAQEYDSTDDTSSQDKVQEAVLTNRAVHIPSATGPVAVKLKIT